MEKIIQVGDRELNVKIVKKKVSITKPIEKIFREGRNDPCPCGSGKKYKKCHWGNVVDFREKD